MVQNQMADAEEPVHLTILHEYGASRHFDALYYLQRRGTIGQIRSVQFGLHRRLVMAALGRHPGWLRDLLQTLRIGPGLLARSNQTLVLFAAPYDPVIPLFHWLRGRNRVIYWISWPYWDGTRYPRKPLYRGQIDQWHRFLEGLTVVTVTEAAQRALADLGANAVRIPHCVDASVFTPPLVPRKSPITKILYVGRLHREKGVDMLIDIAREHHWDNVEYWFVGRGNLEGQVQAASKECAVRHFGYVTDQARLAEIYREADMLVLPSRKTKDWEELFGITLIEAMASGLPVVATDCVGPQEIVDDGATGFIVGQGNKQEFVERLGYLVQRPQIRRCMGQEGRRRAVADYDVAVVAAAWRDVLCACATVDSSAHGVQLGRDRQ